RGSPGLAPLPPAKRVLVYRNGDPFFRGRKMVVNQRRFLTFEAFLGEVTQSVGAAVAVRNLYTPRRGRRVARLRDLRDGCHYVAAGSESFKRLEAGPCRSSGSSRGGSVTVSVPISVPSPARQRPGSSASPCRGRSPVFRNGDLLSPPFRLPLSRSTLLDWDALLRLLTDKVHVRSGAVRKLCRLDGAQVSGGEELVNGGYYVAVGAEKYQNLPYLELLVPQ
ncbi:DCD2B protein, partial [Nothocercus nigrocapillus]|nr:DCD2B protein [Nothocercus nigrocapillus]